jgi:hypothetical protein
MGWSQKSWTGRFSQNKIWGSALDEVGRQVIQPNKYAILNDCSFDIAYFNPKNAPDLKPK